MNRILIVEDDVTLSVGLRFDLEAEHYLVTLAGTAVHSGDIFNRLRFGNRPDERL